MTYMCAPPIYIYIYTNDFPATTRYTYSTELINSKTDRSIHDHDHDHGNLRLHLSYLLYGDTACTACGIYRLFMTDTSLHESLHSALSRITL